MEEFEFELLKTELLTQPIEGKDGAQLFHRKVSLTSAGLKKVIKALQQQLMMTNVTSPSL